MKRWLEIHKQAKKEEATMATKKAPVKKTKEIALPKIEPKPLKEVAPNIPPDVDITLFANFLKQTNGTMVIKKSAITTLKELQDTRKVAQQTFEALDKRLKQDELAMIAALEAKFVPETGSPKVEITIDKEIRPKWKDEAIKLAVQDGLNAEVYVATVRSLTKPTEYKHIVITKE